MCCRCIPLLGGKHMCVWVRGKKNLLKEALFGHFKLYCISLTEFSYFLNRRIFFSRILLMKFYIDVWKMYTPFSFLNTENLIVLILFITKVNLSAPELIEGMANSKQSASLPEMILFFLLFTDSNLKLSGAHKLVHILNVSLICYC